MKKNIKKILTTSLIASFALTTALGVSVFAMPKAETDFSDFTMDAGAGVRMDTPTGIRFTANVGEKTKASLENATDVTFGMLIAPTTGDDGVLTLDDVTDVNVKAKNLVTAVWADGSTDWTAETAVKYNGAIVGGETVDFPKDEYATVLNAVGYVTYTVDDVTTTEYTTSMANRSLAQAASNSLANGVADPNGVLSGIVSEVVNSVSFADETIELTLNATKAESATVSASADVNTDLVTVTYESNNPSVATVDIYGNVTAKSEGNATITASAGKVKDTLDVVVKGSTTLLNDCAAVGSVGRTSWGWPTIYGTNDSLTTVETTAPVDVPANYAGSSTNSNYTSQQVMKSGGNGADGRVVPAFEIPSFFNNIESYDDKDYLGVWVYVESTSSVLWNSGYGFSKGRPHIENSAYTVSTNAEKTPELSYSKGIPCNAWTMLKISVGSIRTLIETKPDVDYDTFILDLRFGGNSGKVYYYAVDVYEFETTLIDCTDTAMINTSSWCGTDTTSIVSDQPKGVPTAYDGAKTDTSYIQQDVYVKPSNNLADHIVAFETPTLFENLAYLDDSDYVGIWTYVEAPQGTLNSNKMYVSLSDYGTEYRQPHTNSSKQSAGVEISDIATNTWTMVKISIHTIRALVEANPTMTFDAICFEYQVETVYATSAETEKIYFYAVELYENEKADINVSLYASIRNLWKTTLGANKRFVEDIPSNYTGSSTKTTSTAIDRIWAGAECGFAINVSALTANADTWDDNDYLSIWMKVEAQQGVTALGEFAAGRVAIQDGNANGNAQAYDGTTYADCWKNNVGLYGQGKWFELKITKAVIQAIIDSNTTDALNTFSDVKFISTYQNFKNTAVTAYLYTAEFVKVA